MPVFEYTARDADGRQLQGTVEASDRNGAMTQISAQGLFPVSITGGGAAVEAEAERSRCGWALGQAGRGGRRSQDRGKHVAAVLSARNADDINTTQRCSLSQPVLPFRDL